MKYFTKTFGVAILLIANTFFANGQNTWNKMSSFPGVARSTPISFTIGHYAFVGMGNNGLTGKQPLFMAS